MFIIYGGMHPSSHNDRLYIPRKDGGRDLIAIEDCVELLLEVWRCMLMKVRKDLCRQLGEIV